MRFLASLLMGFGVLVGVATAALVVVGGAMFGLTWIVSVGLAKMMFLTSLGFLGSGAVVLRLDRLRRDDQLAAKQDEWT
jgi:hypothetical protein